MYAIAGPVRLRDRWFKIVNVIDLRKKEHEELPAWVK